MARGAEMLRLDLEAASIPYVVDGPDGPLYADFHSLRHSFITALGRGGVELRTAQELAGHSSPALTARYAHRRLYDLAGAVEKLPRFLPDAPAPEALRATGTDQGLPRAYTPLTQAADSGCSRLRLVGEADPELSPLPTGHNFVIDRGLRTVGSSCE